VEVDAWTRTEATVVYVGLRAMPTRGTRRLGHQIQSGWTNWRAPATSKSSRNVGGPRGASLTADTRKTPAASVLHVRPSHPSGVRIFEPPRWHCPSVCLSVPPLKMVCFGALLCPVSHRYPIFAGNSLNRSERANRRSTPSPPGQPPPIEPGENFFLILAVAYSSPYLIQEAGSWP